MAQTETGATKSGLWLRQADMTETEATKQIKSDEISALAQPAQGCQRRAATVKIR